MFELRIRQYHITAGQNACSRLAEVHDRNILHTVVNTCITSRAEQRRIAKETETFVYQPHTLHTFRTNILLLLC